MSFCKQAQAPARGGGLLGRPWLRVPLNGCRKTKPFQSVPWKRETTVLGMAERERESFIWETESCDLSLAIGRRRKTLRICVVGKAEGKQPQTSQMERKMCISECFRLWAVIVLSCAYVFYTAIHNCPIQFALWTMMLIFSCPTFTFPNHHGLYSKLHFSSSLKMSPLLLPGAILALQKNHRDGFCMADGIKKENQEATFNNWKSFRMKRIFQ